MTHSDKQHGVDRAKKIDEIIGDAASAGSVALARWLNTKRLLHVDSIEHLDFSEAANCLHTDEPTCCCSMALPESLPGQIMLFFQDASGWALAEMVLSQPVGWASQWDELEISAVLESTNILCCAFLNRIVAGVVRNDPQYGQIVPAPPDFRRDFAESILESALADQFRSRDRATIVQAKYVTPDRNHSWSMLWIPELASLERLFQQEN